MRILDFRVMVREQAREFEKYVRESIADGQLEDSYSEEEWFDMFKEFIVA